jgi:3,4-dihydroxy 2-butanone 4-phosphate synthase/GTP cyclohydrolase II
MTTLDAESEVRLDDIEYAIKQIRDGRPVVVVKGNGHDSEGALIFAAELATPSLLAFMVKHTSGFVCVAITDADANRLDLPAMYSANEGRAHVGYRVSADARQNIGTGISATDRAHTIRLLADPRTRPLDLTRPGHVVPLRANRRGVLSRPGHTEAAMDLAELAGFQPAGVLCGIVSQCYPAQMAQAPELRQFCDDQGLAMISVGNLITYRQQRGAAISMRAQARLPLPQGSFLAIGYRTASDSREHLVLVHGDISSGESVLVRVQPECLTGDVFGSHRCDCRSEVDATLWAVAREKRGVVLYMRGGRSSGVGPLRKLAEYQAKDAGSGPLTVETMHDPVTDAAEHRTAAEILTHLGIKSMRLLTSNPLQHVGLETYGMRVIDRIPLSPGQSAQEVAG